MKRKLSLLISAGALAGAAIVTAGTIEVGTLKTGTIKAMGITPLPAAQRLEMHLSFATDKGGAVEDASGNGRHGTAHNAAWTGAGRFVGGAMAWRGANAWDGMVAVTNAPDFTAWDSYSVSLWFKYDTAGPYSDCNVLFDTAAGGYYEGITMYLSDNTLYVFLIDPFAYIEL
jgi:hypothetical protein